MTPLERQQFLHWGLVVLAESDTATTIYSIYQSNQIKSTYIKIISEYIKFTCRLFNIHPIGPPLDLHGTLSSQVAPQIPWGEPLGDQRTWSQGNHGRVDHGFLTINHGVNHGVLELTKFSPYIYIYNIYII